MRSIRPTLLVLLLFALWSVGAACADDDDTTTETAQDDAANGAVEPGTPPERDADAPRQMERHIFELVNAEREERGLAPFEWSDELAEEARGWSADMAERGTLEHDDIDAVLAAGDGLEAVGENVFYTNRPGPAGRVHVGWMESDGHRRNVLDPGFDRLGVGVVCTDEGEVYATQRFGRAMGSDLPRPDESVPPAEPVVADPDGGPSC